MNSEQRNTPKRPLSNRKSRDRAIILPLAGLLLLLPPFAHIFQLEIRVFGIPFTMLYLFLVWAVLIGCAAHLSSRLEQDNSLEEESILPSEAER